MPRPPDIPDPKFAIGDTVSVKHWQCGDWTGEVTHSAFTGTGTATMSGWEYEVSNAPRDHTKQWPDDPLVWRPGCRWHPLVWEEEMTLIHSEEDVHGRTT